jgi:hypothetical protein
MANNFYNFWLRAGGGPDRSGVGRGRNALAAKNNVRESYWTQSIAVGSQQFTEKVLSDLGYRTKGRTTCPSRMPNIRLGQGERFRRGKWILKDDSNLQQ